MDGKKPIKAIIWDLDGTLIHFKIDYIKARRVAIKILKDYGVPKALLTVKISILENMRFARDYFEKEGYSIDEINKIIQQVDHEINKIEYEAAINAIMINGIDKVVEYAKNKNLKQAIFTFNTTRNAEISLKKVNLLQYFEVIIGRDNIYNLKPHPDHINTICRQLNVKIDEVLIIGDTIRDIEAAINVGAPSIAIHTKLSKLETLNNADVIIEENEIPLELIKEIEKLL